MRLFIIIALLLALASPAYAIKPTASGLPSALDYGSAAWITYPDVSGCVASSKSCSSGTTPDTQKWTPDRIASMGRVVVLMNGGDINLGIPGRLEVGGNLVPDFPPYRSSAFGLNFDDGRENQREPDLRRYFAEIESRPKGNLPIKTFGMRWDLAYREQLSRIGDFALTPSMLLRTDRPLADVATSFEGGDISLTDTSRCGGAGTDCGFSVCRGPNTDTKTADEIYGAVIVDPGAGCGRVYDGTSNKERGVRLDQLLENIGTGLGESVPYYIARPDSNDKVFYPYAVLVDMLDEDLQTVYIEWCRRAHEIGYDACDFPHKDHQLRTSHGNFTPPAHWPIADDAFGGYSMSQLVAAETPFSGPPKRANGDTWNYARRKLAEVQIIRRLDTEGLNTVRIVNPSWFEGCPKDIADWDSAYDDAACDGAGESDEGWDDPATLDEEDAYQREIVARADYCIIQTGGKVLSGANGGLGSGGGSGFSYQELRSLIHSMESPDGTPCVVIGYENGGNTAIPPKFYRNLSEDNPETDLEVCGDGAVSNGEECDDGNTTSGDGCDKWCRLPDVFVVSGQSNAVGYSTQGADTAAPPRVTSPNAGDALTGLKSQNYRYRYTDPGESAGGSALAILNDFPCADSQCTGTECTGANRTAAGHPDTNAGDGDGTCSCFCGTHGSAFATWEGGSPWPTFAKRYMQEVGREVMLIDVTKPGQALIYDDDGAGPNPFFYPYADCSLQNTDYDDQTGDGACGIYRAANLAGVANRVKAVLWVQGEAEVTGGTSSGNYQIALSALSDKINSEYGRTIPLMVSTISTRGFGGDSCTDGTGAFARIKTGQLAAIAADPDIYQGPDLDDIPLHDGGVYGTDQFGNGSCVHYQDQELHGERWYEAVRSLLTNQDYTGN